MIGGKLSVRGPEDKRDQSPGRAAPRGCSARFALRVTEANPGEALPWDHVALWCPAGQCTPPSVASRQPAGVPFA